MGMHGRSIYSLAKLPYLMYPHEKHTNPHVLLGEHLASACQPVVVAESMFDLFAVYEAYPNVVSPLKAGITAQTIHRLDGAVMIITLFDGDKAGDLGRAKIEKHATCPVHHLVPPDGEDAGSMSPEDLKDSLDSCLAEVYSAESVTL
jgi:DNA primase